MHFDHIHPLPPTSYSFQRHSPYISLSDSGPLLSFNLHLVLMCLGINCSVDNLPGATPLKKTDVFFHNSNSSPVKCLVSSPTQLFQRLMEDLWMLQGCLIKDDRPDQLMPSSSFKDRFHKSEP